VQCMRFDRRFAHLPVRVAALSFILVPIDSASTGETRTRHTERNSARDACCQRSSSEQRAAERTGDHRSNAPGRRRDIAQCGLDSFLERKTPWRRHPLLLWPLPLPLLHTSRTRPAEMRLGHCSVPLALPSHDAPREPRAASRSSVRVTGGE
jgi:hypothetical protein